MAGKSSAGKSIRKKAADPTVRKEMGRKSTRRRANPSTRLRTGLKPDLVIKNDSKILKALYAIADAASAVKDMQSFYKKLHKIVGKLMYAENFFIALHDEQTDLITWPYVVDTVYPEASPPTRLSEQTGAAGWVLRHGRTITDVDGGWPAALTGGEAQQRGIEWTGIAVPLKVKTRTVGRKMRTMNLDSISILLVRPRARKYRFGG